VPDHRKVADDRGLALAQISRDEARERSGHDAGAHGWSILRTVAHGFVLAEIADEATEGGPDDASARSEPPAAAREPKVDRRDALRRWQLVQDRADDPLHVVLVVPEVVQERFERGMGELELGWGELESIGNLVGFDQADVVG
jgi:hypothetical protein